MWVWAAQGPFDRLPASSTNSLHVCFDSSWHSKKARQPEQGYRTVCLHWHVFSNFSAVICRFESDCRHDIHLQVRGRMYQTEYGKFELVPKFSLL